MKVALMIITSAALLASSSAMANVDLAKAKNCMACHTVEKKVLGPGFKEIAKKYAGDKTAESKLVTKVLKGGSGAWGVVPMPANAQVSEAEAKTLVTWILALK
jgi:cytochrome c